MILFDFNDVFAEFSKAIEEKFGKKPIDMNQSEYDRTVSTLVRTDFYANLERCQAGVDLLVWANSFDDRRSLVLLVNEKTSPLWVHNQKLAFLDAICAEYNITKLDFNTVETEAKLIGHAYRGPFVTRFDTRYDIWNAAMHNQKRLGYRAVFLRDDLQRNINDIQASITEHDMWPGGQ